MYLSTTAQNFNIAFAADVTATSYAVTGPQTTVPSGSGVIDNKAGNGGEQQKRILFSPYGVGTTGCSYGLKVWGWNKVPSFNSAVAELWVPQLLGYLQLALTNSLVGVDGSVIDSTHYFMDFTVNFMSDSPAGANDFNFLGANYTVPGWVYLSTLGSQIIQFDINVNDPLSGYTSATSGNVLWRFFAE